MAKASPAFHNFTAGELSPRLEGRTDVSKYFNGCATLSNFIVHPHGGASRRSGTIFVTEVKDSPEEKLKITKIAWEIEGARSVKNDLKIKEEFNFKQSAKDILITSQLRSALIFNKKIKSSNYSLDTYKKKIYIYGIAETKEEQSLVLDEAKEILDVEEVISSILLVEDLRIQKN